jgi:hypothetical protein
VVVQQEDPCRIRHTPQSRNQGSALP